MVNKLYSNDELFSKWEMRNSNERLQENTSFFVGWSFGGRQHGRRQTDLVVLCGVSILYCTVLYCTVLYCCVQVRLHYCTVKSETTVCVKECVALLLLTKTICAYSARKTIYSHHRQNCCHICIPKPTER
jgi:hypothetical protein